jgi:hypothetical protein
MTVSSDLANRVHRIVGATPVHDIHTHLYDPSFGSLLLCGIDDLLVYHYLVSEAFRQADFSYPTFWAANKVEQAEWIWDALFLRHSPVSEACRGVLTTLQALGLDPRKQDLPKLRRWFAAQEAEEYVDRVLSRANVASICMTNSPFDGEERPFWEKPVTRDSRFHAALRIDPILVQWGQTAATLAAWGYEVSSELNPRTADGVRRFLADWTKKIGSRYCMVSLPPTFAYPANTETAWLIEHAVLPHCREHGQPFAMMLGVKRAVNPSLAMAGDGMGRSDLTALENLCARNPDNRFLATCLSRENQHELVVLARKFRNLHPFGCWWFTNTPQMIAEITTMRLELLGTSFTPQHSDARVLDQLIYKWQHSRAILGTCLAEKYAGLEAVGWAVTDEAIQRDVTELLGGGFEKFRTGGM